MSEYTNSTSGNSGCSYQTLCAYNSNGAMAPVQPSQTVGTYVVPMWGAIGNDALTHGGSGNCGGYFTIMSAYGANAGKCNTEYATSNCNACNK